MTEVSKSRVKGLGLPPYPTKTHASIQPSAPKSRPSLIFIKKRMSEGGYKIRNQSAVHFITFAVVEWIDVFTRKQYRDIVLDSIRFCKAEKGLRLHSWCIMSNHLHLIISAKENNLSEVLRDFKKFTSKELIKAITSNKQESRREWMLDIFRREGSKNSRNNEYQFWRQDNQPMEFVQRGIYFSENELYSSKSCRSWHSGKAGRLSV